MPTTKQMLILTEFLENNPGIASGSMRTAAAKAETKRKWMMVAPSINKAGDTIKNGLEWAKYWAEKKCALKKQCAEQLTFKGDLLYNLSELDKRMIGAMGGLKAVIGNSLLDLPPASPSSLDSNPLVLDSNPPSPISSCPSPLNPPKKSEENYRERSPIRFSSPVRSPKSPPLKKQALRSTTMPKEAKSVPAKAPTPGVDSQERTPIRPLQTPQSKKPVASQEQTPIRPLQTPQSKKPGDSKDKTPIKPLQKPQSKKPDPKIKRSKTDKKGVFVSNEIFSELASDVNKMATAQHTISNALSMLAKAFLEISKKIPA